MEMELRRLNMPSQLETREDGEDLYIEGYFAVFDSNYDIAPGMSESIAQGAFTNSISGDVRALINHDTTLVMGRTTANTLELKQDSHGLYGRVRVNPKDQDAVNCHARVMRGDVDQCSIGFEILNEEADYREGGSVHWTIRDIKLYEVSVCTFPAYTETSVKARQRDAALIREKRNEVWKAEMLERLRKG